MAQAKFDPKSFERATEPFDADLDSFVVPHIDLSTAFKLILRINFRNHISQINSKFDFTAQSSLQLMCTHSNIIYEPPNHLLVSSRMDLSAAIILGLPFSGSVILCLIHPYTDFTHEIHLHSHVLTWEGGALPRQRRWRSLRTHISFHHLN